MAGGDENRMKMLPFPLFVFPDAAGKIRTGLLFGTGRIGIPVAVTEILRAELVAAIRPVVMQGPDDRFPDGGKLSDGQEIAVDPMQMDHIGIRTVDRIEGGKREQAFGMAEAARMPEQIIPEIHGLPECPEKRTEEMPSGPWDDPGDIVAVNQAAFHTGG